MSYLKVFAPLNDSPDWQLDGDNMLVEMFDDGEDSVEITRADGSKASLILAESTSGRQAGSFAEHKGVLVRVLKVGRGYFKEDGTLEPVDLQPGAIVEVPKMSISYRSKILGLVAPEKSLGYVTRSSALQTFPSEEAYRSVCAKVKEAK